MKNTQRHKLCTPKLCITQSNVLLTTQKSFLSSASVKWMQNRQVQLRKALEIHLCLDLTWTIWILWVASINLRIKSLHLDYLSWMLWQSNQELTVKGQDGEVCGGCCRGHHDDWRRGLHRRAQSYTTASAVTGGYTHCCSLLGKISQVQMVLSCALSATA